MLGLKIFGSCSSILLHLPFLLTNVQRAYVDKAACVCSQVLKGLMKADSCDYGDGLVIGRRKSSKAELAAAAENGDAGADGEDSAAKVYCVTPAQPSRLALMQNGVTTTGAAERGLHGYLS